VGVELRREPLASARARLAEGGAPYAPLVRADLAAPLPFADGTFEGVVCHNVLECLAAPERLLEEIARVLRPGGRLVLGHADFDTLVWSGGDLALERRIVRCFCDTQQFWMAHADGTIGRKLPGYVAASPLVPAAVEVHVTVDRTWAPGAPGHDFAHDAVGIARGAGGFSEDELAAWLADLAAHAARGAFFFSLNTVLVVAEKAAAR
jgi:SAM-dependent methyltransferase